MSTDKEMPICSGRAEKSTTTSVNLQSKHSNNNVLYLSVLISAISGWIFFTLRLDEVLSKWLSPDGSVLNYLRYLLSCSELCRRVQEFVSVRVHSWLKNYYNIYAHLSHLPCRGVAESEDRWTSKTLVAAIPFGRQSSAFLMHVSFSYSRDS